MTRVSGTAGARDLRQKLLTLMTKLTDKDTFLNAVSDLETLIPTLSPDTFSLFITSLSSTSTTDRAAVRAASLSLLSSLSLSHGRALSPHLPKLVSAVLRRLRDNDSNVKSAAANATSAFSANVVHSLSSFSSHVLKPLSDALSSEQDVNAQMSAAMSLASAIDAGHHVDASQIHRLLPKWMKLLKCDSFKAKAALLGLIRSAIRACEIGNCNLLKDLVSCIIDFLKSEEWMARKAAAEALREVAVVEKDSLSEMKALCLKTFEPRKFDKIKAVREAMTQMVAAWKEVPDVYDDGSHPAQSQASSKENASDGRCPTRSRISSAVDSNSPHTRRKNPSHRRSSPSDSALRTTAGNRGTRDVTGNKCSPPIFRKLNYQKSSAKNVDTNDFHDSSITSTCEDNPAEYDEGILPMADVKTSRPETKSGLFSKNTRSRVVPYPEDGSDAAVVVNDISADVCRHHKDFEDLSLIKKQLVQIENQQSSLMDLLQKFIGSSQDGMHTLETRVQGLELALDDISYDLAVSTARMSSAEPSRTSCCLLPGSDFLSSKFWRRPEGRGSVSQFSYSGSTPAVSAMRSLADRNPAGDAYRLEPRRFHIQAPGGVIVNPLANMPSDSRGLSKASSSRVMKSVRNVA